MAEDPKMVATSPSCTPPSFNNIATPQLKRKRSDSCDSVTGHDAPVATRRCQDLTPDTAMGVNQGSPTVNKSPSADPATAEKLPKSRNFDIFKLRGTLEAQLSLEVLLKHNELRLIDQEIAKCQVALEQLRRCAEIPYPGSNATGISQSVSEGTGMAVLPPGNGPAPVSPAPWGVTDGAYTRHYSKWLLPDPRFDGGEIDTGASLTAGAGPPLVEGRVTRANPGDGGAMATKSRPRRGSSAAKLQSLSNGYPPPKEKAGPMLIRRKSDGVMVKLVCLDCRRDNFSSTQGFINHCRIAHNRNFASHDAAAMASGEPVEVDDAGTVVGGKDATASGSAGYVHPLIRSAHGIESSPTPGSSLEVSNDTGTPQKRSETSISSVVETPQPPVDSRRKGRSPLTTGRSSDNPFMASPDTPHLSSLMQVKGVGMDLDQLVGETKTTFDLEAYSSEDEHEDDSTQPFTDMSQGDPPHGARAGRQPMRTTVAQTASERPSSSKGRGKVRHRPHPLRAVTPSRTGPFNSSHASVPSALMSNPGGELQEVDGVVSSVDLSPNTVELNQAPSLVSDDDDYEAAVDSESPSPSSSEAGDHDQDIGHINVGDDEGTTTSAAAADPKTNPELTDAAHSGPLPHSLRRGGAKKDDLISSSMVPLSRGKDDKHVSFVSPQTSPAKGKKGNNRRPSQGK